MKREKKRRERGGKSMCKWECGRQRGRGREWERKRREEKMRERGEYVYVRKGEKQMERLKEREGMGR